MKEITAYLAADGSIHASEEKAKAKDDDLLGEELDGLLKMFNLDITRNQEYKALLHVMKSRDALAKTMREIVRIIEHSEAND